MIIVARKIARARAARLLGLALGSSFCLAQPAQGEEVSDSDQWTVTLNVTQAILGEEASDVTVAGNPLPDAGVRIGDATTVTADIGYSITPDIAANLFFGVPASAKIVGAGSVESLGTLGETRYGPVVLSAQYHFNSQGVVRPYVGLGVGRIVFFGKDDGALSDFDIEDRWAPAGQAGVRVRVADGLMLNADARYVPFSTVAEGALGGAPVSARLRIRPILANVGIAYRF